ncbi:MAG: proprotein convertase P-domain-containing protein [Myxococcales bacterium]|nr:proprotein convertase P-domain-containing protein [Myxococcales bacterium]
MDLNVEDDFEAKSVKLQLDIEHTYVGDLYIELAHEDGFSVTIREKGTGGSAHDINELIDVPELAGKTIGGEWSLLVSDNARIDEGTVKRWALVVEAAE